MVAMETSKSNTEASLTTLIEVWDIEKSVLVESFVTRTSSVSSETLEEPREIIGVEADDNPAAAIASLVRSRQPVGKRQPSAQGGLKNDIFPPSSDVRTMVGGLEFGGYSVQRPDVSGVVPEPAPSSRPAGRGFIVCGSEDRKIRLWDLGKLDRTTVLSGLESEHDKPSFRCEFEYSLDAWLLNSAPCSTACASNGEASVYIETRPPSNISNSQNNRPPQRMSLITNNQQNLLKSHQDVITALACIDSPFRGGIVSGDRSGVLKVFRVEMADQ